MKDVSDTPFWGKQKPFKKYIAEHSLTFSVKNKKLFCTVMKTTKTTKQTLFAFEVKNKSHLDQLLRIKSFHELKIDNLIT